ncbi:hypothetical protein F4677DRAFT_441903 [Hypoxylon crocopeplum]|nr:hypothetical protein F4677DRAFT_441903 [Hypoxylon crocopeplum]
MVNPRGIVLKVGGTPVGREMVGDEIYRLGTAASFQPMRLAYHSIDASKHPRSRGAAKFSDLTGGLMPLELAGINDQ